MKFGGRPKNLGLQAFSLALALLTWFYVDSELSGTRTVRVPLRVHPPEGYLLLEEPPRELLLTVRSDQSKPAPPLPPEVNVELRLPAKLSPHERGELELKLPPQELNLPPGVVLAWPPGSLHLRLARAEEKALPVKARFAGALPAGRELSRVEVLPREVVALGPAEALSKLDHLETESIPLSGRSDSFSALVRLQSANQPGEDRVLLREDKVVVAVSIREEAERAFQGLEVKLLRAPGEAERFSLLTPRVNLRLRGERVLLGRLSTRDILVVVELARAGPPNAGERELPVRAFLPSGVELVGPPPTVRLRARF